MPIDQTHTHSLTHNMKNSFSFLVFFLVLNLSFFISFGALSSIIDETPSSDDFITCLQQSNSTNITQLVFTPINASYLPVWEAQANNLRFVIPPTPYKPSVIVTPTDETQVQTTLSCTKLHGYELRIRGGGHDFEGLSYVGRAPFVMLDFVNMKSIDVNVENQTAWVQAGAVLGELYYAISQKTNTSYFPAGLCPAVGVSGFLGGGGYGNLLRKYALGADNTLDVQFVDVNGNILDRKSMGEDLFWAIRGGGVSNFGIALAWKLKLVPVPEYVTAFIVNVTLEQGATDLVYKLQYVVPNSDRNLQIRVQLMTEYIGNTTDKTVRVLFLGLYQGGADALVTLLDEIFPELNVTRENCQEVRMVQASLLFGGFTAETPIETIANRSQMRKTSYKSKSDYVRHPIPKSGLRRIWRKMLENDNSTIMVFTPFGGKMNEYSETAIPYPHRAGVLYQVLKTVDLTDQPSDTTEVSLNRIAWLRSFDRTLEPYVSRYPREAYFNYNDLDLGVANRTYQEASVWGERYWKRANFKKLIRIKAKVDPDNFFRHPQSIPVFSSYVSEDKPFSDI